MSGSIPTSNVSFSGIVNAYNNVNSTNLPTTNISLSSFRSKSFSDSTSVPSSGAISINSHFKGKTWGGSGLLYSFSSHIFTNCGATGASGPTLSQCRSSYSPSWTDNTSYFNVTQTGYQIWTVPRTANYTIDAYGARGGANHLGANAGNGARCLGTFSLTEGDKYMIVVGQIGSVSSGGQETWAGCGGGGGTFIVKGTNYSSAGTGDVLIVAGGGGGPPRADVGSYGHDASSV